MVDQDVSFSLVASLDGDFPLVLTVVSEVVLFSALFLRRRQFDEQNLGIFDLDVFAPLTLLRAEGFQEINMRFSNLKI
jgi:hypothetical protein